MIWKHESELKPIIVLELSIFVTCLSSCGNDQLGILHLCDPIQLFWEVDQPETASIVVLGMVSISKS